MEPSPRSSRVSDEEYARRLRVLERMETVRENAIADGMRLRTPEEFEAEMERRFGDEEPDEGDPAYNEEMTPTIENPTAPVARDPRERSGYAERRAALDEMWRLRDEAVAEGMELWDLDRVNEEVRRLRYGDLD